MKHLKKTLALAMAVCCVGCFAACGGDDSGVPGESVKGVQVTAEEWAAAFAASIEATNLSVNFSETYEFNNEYGSGKSTRSGVAKIADGKIFEEYSAKMTSSQTVDGSTAKMEQSGKAKEYYYAEESVWYSLEWNSIEDKWIKEAEDWFSADNCTGAYYLDELPDDFTLYTYSADKNAYVYEETEEDMTFSVEIKIKDGKIAAAKMTEAGEEGGGTGSESIAMEITYGGASVTIPTDIVIADDAE